MPLDDFEKERIRYHLGYLNATNAASLQFGVPVPVETIFLVEQAFNFLLEPTLPRVRKLLDRLDRCEELMDEGADYLAAKRLGDLEIDEENIERLEDLYWRWANRLADNMGVPLYAYSARFQHGGGIRAGNLRVRNS